MFKHELRRVSGPKARLRLDLMCKGIQGYLECIKKKTNPKIPRQAPAAPLPGGKTPGVSTERFEGAAPARGREEGSARVPSPLPGSQVSLAFPPRRLRWGNAVGGFAALGPRREGETEPAPSQSARQPINKSSAPRY